MTPSPSYDEGTSPCRTPARGRKLSANCGNYFWGSVPDREPLFDVLGLLDLVDETGETANLAVLAGDQAEYVAQAPSRHHMRMFTEIGQRVDLHSTGVGKALLSQLGSPDFDDLLDRRGLPGRTEHTITSRVRLHAELERIRSAGFHR